MAGGKQEVIRSFRSRWRAAVVLICLCGFATVAAPVKPDARLERLTRWLNSNDEAQRADAVSELSVLHQAECVPLLLQALKDPSIEVRNRAAWSLQNFRDARVVPALRAALSDENDRVRASAIWSMSHIGGRGVVDDAIRLARTDASGIVRFRAVWGLAFLKDKSALPVVIEALGDYNNSVRERSALIALEALADKSVVSRLLSQTNNVLPATRRVVMYLLARYGNETVVPALQASLRDPDALVRGEAALSLGKLHARKALPELTMALSDPDEHVRGSAAYALGLIGDKSAVGVLRPLLEDKTALVRAITAESLQRLGDKAVKPPDGFKAADLYTFPIYSPEHADLYR